jgi:hypothetical protein
MQNLFNKYGEDNVFFEVVEVIENQDGDFIVGREKYYIDTLKPYINHILDPVNIVRDEVYCQRISESKKKYFETHEIHNKRVVYQYNLEGDFIKEYDSLTAAHNDTFIDVTAICGNCNNRASTAGGYRWSYDKVEKLGKLKKNYKYAPVLQYTLDEEFVKEWDSKKEAEKTLGISNISRACTKNLTAGGFKWKRKDESPL